MNFIKEIEQLVQRYADAVHSQDENEFKSLWTREETNAEISGTKYFQGVDSIYQDFLLNLINGKYSSIYLVNDDLRAYPLTEDTAVVIFKYHTDCIVRATGEKYGMTGIETQVLKKTKDGWRIAHIQYHGKDMPANPNG